MFTKSIKAFPDTPSGKAFFMHEPDRAQFSVASVDVTILLPCLNEIQALPHCLTNAHAALRRIEAEYGFTGEILASDNGSTDGS